MSEPGAVEMINAILNGEDNFILLVQRPQLERIRDEIVALRDRDRSSDVRAVYLQRAARDETLEEAARVCDAYADQPTVDTVSLPDTIERTAYAVVQQSIAAVTCAAVIRALKEQSDD